MRTSIHAYFAAANEGGSGSDNQIETSDANKNSQASVDPSTGTVEQTNTSGSIELGGGSTIPATEPVTEDADKKPEGEDEQGGEEQEEAPPVPRIEGDFKADDPESVKAFDTAFKADNGALKMDALSQQWWDNYAKSGDAKEGTLDENTYAYLESLGLRREDVKNFERAQVALNEKGEGQLHEAAGGVEAFSEMLAWGRDGGYTEAQRKAFNDALARGGPDAHDAVELLATRFRAANGSSTPSRSIHEAPRTPGGHGDGGGSTDVFGSREEWLAARKEAGSNMDAQQKVSEKYRRSPGASRW